jgi:site-specific DNA-methyltransferase (adenine-specific)
MNTAVMFSSETDLWSTPQDFFDELDKEFNFTLDPCATSENAKCDKYYTVVENGLNQDWQGHTVFCNPPYGKVIKDWVKKCYEESLKPNTTVVMLIPARTDTSYFHDYIYRKAREIRFIRGRRKIEVW